MDTRISYSTISFLKQNLKYTLDMFKKMRFENIELHLAHFLVKKENPQLIKDFNIQIVDGSGFCNFFSKNLGKSRTITSVDRQVDMADKLGCNNLRLFLGTMERDVFTEDRLDIAVENINIAIERHPHINFLFENSPPGITNSPIVIRDILQRVNNSHIKTVFDPKTYEEDRVSPIYAATIVDPYVSHVHLSTKFAEDHLVAFFSLHNYLGCVGLEYEMKIKNPFMELFDAGQRLKKIL